VMAKPSSTMQVTSSSNRVRKDIFFWWVMG
jgi:hypothetical protein